MEIYFTSGFETERQKALSNAMLCKAARATFSSLLGDPPGKFTF